ncbi:hypothetical protein [Cupriavidus sp.]|uniref:hypothetical protein n=1 Tax=Cupriavidus sp. TaxID=1873897 RepID=UPI003D0E76B9
MEEINTLKSELLHLQGENTFLLTQLGICQQAHTVLTYQVARLERLAHSIKDAAVTRPDQRLARWVKFGPESAFLASLTKPQQCIDATVTRGETK